MPEDRFLLLFVMKDFKMMGIIAKLKILAKVYKAGLVVVFEKTLKYTMFPFFKNV